MTELSYDFPGLRVGIAEYPDGPTGCTVLLLPGPCRTAVDERGGAVGLVGGFPVNSALCFAGGSIHGFPAISGVAAELLEQGGNATGFADLLLVSGAVVYDYRGRDNTIAPDADLGRAALRAARAGVFPAGRRGAGRHTSVGKIAAERSEPAGQGMACRRVGAANVFVATVVNAVGVVVDRAGTIVRGNLHAESGERRHLWQDYTDALGGDAALTTPGGNTTLTALVTNVRLTDGELQQLARLVHSSMSRAIQPLHTGADGDVLFAVTTDEVGVPELDATGLGVIAAEVAWDAVLASVADR